MAVAWVAVSRGIPDRRADLKQDFGDLMQEGLDRATAGQVQFDAVLVLNHPHGEFEQFQDHGGRLGVGQFGMDQDFSAQRLMQDIGTAGKEQAQVVGQEAMIGSAVRGQIMLEHFDPILILSAGTVEIAVKTLGGGLVEGGDDETGIVSGIAAREASPAHLVNGSGIGRAGERVDRGVPGARDKPQSGSQETQTVV